MQITAAVVRERFGPFVLDTLELCEPRAEEVIVRVAASGMCQTDLHGRDGYYGTPYPEVFGHEGAGVVHAVGRAVRLGGGRSRRDVLSVVRRLRQLPRAAPDLLPARARSEDERHARRRLDAVVEARRAGLQRVLSAIVLCHFRADAGALRGQGVRRRAARTHRPARLQRPDRRRRGAQRHAAAGGRKPRRVRRRRGRTISADGGKDRRLRADHRVDIHEHRLALARELGASHAINYTVCRDVVGEIRKLTAGGVRFSLETSAVPAVFRESVESVMPGGTCVLLGSAPKGSEVSFEMPFLQEGRLVRGVVQGDSVPREFIPKLVDLIMAGEFPIAKIITFYEFADINLAAQESAAGVAIKPVLRMPDGA